MTIFNHDAYQSLYSLTAALDRYTEAAIDPAFDAEVEHCKHSSTAIDC